MPRKNKRKDYLTGKRGVFYSEFVKSAEHSERKPVSERKPQCTGCAFSEYGDICTAEGGTCLLGTGEPELTGVHNATS